MGGDPGAGGTVGGLEEARVFLCADRGQSAFNCPRCQHHVHTPDVRCTHCGADVSLLAQSLRVGPDWFNRGLDAFRRSRYGEAIAALRTAAWLMPEQPRCHVLLAKALAFRGEHAEARRVLLDARARSLVGDEECDSLLGGFEALARVQHSYWQLLASGMEERIVALRRRVAAAGREIRAGAMVLWGWMRRCVLLLAPKRQVEPPAAPALQSHTQPDAPPGLPAEGAPVPSDEPAAVQEPPGSPAGSPASPPPPIEPPVAP